MKESAGNRRWCWLGLLVLLAAHAAGNAWWLRRDHHPIVADEALHMQFAEQYYLALFAPREGGLATRLADAAAVESIYPPLLHLVGAALWLVTPYNAEVLAFAVTLAFLALLAGVYFLTQALFSPSRALLAATLTGFIPFLFGASRLFIQDVPAAAFVVWTLYAAHRTAGFQRTRWVLLFAVLAGLGLLTRWTTPLYYAAPALYLVAMDATPLLRDRATRSRALWRLGLHAGVLGGLGLALTLPWYFTHYDTLLHGYQTTFAGQQGRLNWTSLTDWTVYLVYIINAGTFLPLFLLGSAGFAVMLRRREERAAGITLLLWVAVAYVVLTATWSLKAPAPRYVVPFLPAFGMAGAAALAALPRGRWRTAIVGVTAAILVLQYTNLTVAPLRPLHRAEIPMWTSHRAMKTLGQGGIVVFRERVRASAARYYAAFQGDNWPERVIAAIRADDPGRQIRTLPRAQMGLVRLPKVGVERLQGYYWPERNPRIEFTLHTEPDGFAPLRAIGAESPFYPADYADPADPFESWFIRLNPVHAYSVDYEDADAVRVRFSAQYWDSGNKRWLRFGSTGNPPLIEDLHLFQPVLMVETRGVRLQPTRASLEPRVEQVTWYTARYPARPPAVVATADDLAGIADDLATIDFLVVGDAKQQEMRTLEHSFIVIDRFMAYLSGFWEPIEVTVLSRYAAHNG